MRNELYELDAAMPNGTEYMSWRRTYGRRDIEKAAACRVCMRQLQVRSKREFCNESPAQARTLRRSHVEALAFGFGRQEHQNEHDNPPDAWNEGEEPEWTSKVRIVETAP